MFDSYERENAGMELTGDRVSFLNMVINTNGTYEIFQAQTAAKARRFLEGKTLRNEYSYIIVETPEGRWGKDSNGLFLTQLLPAQSNLEAAQCGGIIVEIPSMISLDMASKEHADNFIAEIECGNCGCPWIDGIRYRNKTVVRCPECGSMNLVDSTRIVCYPLRLYG